MAKTFYFDSDIYHDEEGVRDLTKFLIELKSDEEAWLFINTGGGEASIGLGLAHLVAARNINIVVTGYCSSAGVVLFAAAKKRYVYPHSKFWFHKGHGCDQPDQPDLRIRSYIGWLIQSAIYWLRMRFTKRKKVKYKSRLTSHLLDTEQDHYFYEDLYNAFVAQYLGVSKEEISELCHVEGNLSGKAMIELGFAEQFDPDLKALTEEKDD